jgi:RND family efflux transporter MFP subunit
MSSSTDPTPSLDPTERPAEQAPAAPADPTDPVSPRRFRTAGKLDWRVVGALVVAGVSLPAWITLHSQAKPQAMDLAASVEINVPGGRVTRSDLYTQLPVAAEFRPYQEVELHAKVSGYVNEMKVDFGDRVKAGQLLATLEVPELMAQLTNAMAVERRTLAEYRAAHTNYVRLSAVARQNPSLVAQQELDNAEARDGTAEAAIAAAKADVEKYQTMIAYTRITAPFDGVVTRRYVDPGTLIQAGTASDTQSLPVVRVSDNYRLRLDFPVQVKYVKDIQLGAPVEVHVESLGNKVIQGKISRASYRVEEATRTMITEIEVPNPNLQLVPGMYASVLLKLDPHPHALAIPIEAVPAGQSASVYVVNDQNQIEERPVTLGLDTATQYEVLNGLKEGERVLLGSRSRVHPGQKVAAKLSGALARD